MDIEKEMNKRGYFLEDTGGNCNAYTKSGNQLMKYKGSVRMTDGEIMITVKADALAPESLSNPVAITTKYGDELENEFTLFFNSLNEYLILLDI